MTQKSSAAKPKLRRAKSLLGASEPAKKKATKAAATGRAKTKTAAPKKTTAAKTVSTKKKSANDLDQKIAEKAFELFQRRGHGHG
ncbi:MAG: hypothetical protein K8I00_11750, partial [Candidatus Omnitrophica bacterium]|nr:hypothetical protein [Candidatus Omnitrophota bacterium]